MKELGSARNGHLMTNGSSSIKNLLIWLFEIGLCVYVCELFATNVSDGFGCGFFKLFFGKLCVKHQNITVRSMF